MVKDNIWTLPQIFKNKLSEVVNKLTILLVQDSLRNSQILMSVWEDPLTSVATTETINLIQILKTTGIKTAKNPNQTILPTVRSVKNSFLIMAPDIKDNGNRVLDMVTESKYGPTVPSMKVTGKIIKLMDTAFSGMSMVTNTRANGRETKPTDMVNILTAMVPPTREIGAMISSTVKESSSGTITQNTKVNIKKVKNMVRAPILGRTALNTAVNGMKTGSMERVNTPGTMAVNMMETGKTTIWTDLVSIPGKMAGNMRDNIKKIRSTVREFTHGLMEENMTVNGK